MGYMKKEKNWGIGNSSEKGEKMGEKSNCFPDGTPIDPWFYDQTVPVCATGREYGFCHGCLTFGSESVHNRNIIMQNIRVSTGYNFLWLKFRPDTPQRYEHLLVENIEGKTANFININPWTQFYDNKGRTDMPISRGDDLTIRNCRFECDTYFNVKTDEEHYHLSNITLEDLDITAVNTECDLTAAENFTVRNVRITGKEQIEYHDSVTTI